jgi:hypothetical protein
MRGAARDAGGPNGRTGRSDGLRIHGDGPEPEIDSHSLAAYIDPENRKVFNEPFDKTG